MGNYYLHVWRGGALYVDRLGVRCSSIDDVVRIAVRDVGYIMRDEPDVPRSSQCIEIVDERDITIRMVPFEAVAQAA